MSGVFVVSVPDEETRRAIGDVSEGVRVVVWDLYDPPVGASIGEIGMVLIPHYQLDRAPFAQFSRMPALRCIQLPSAGYEHMLPFLPAGVELCNGRGIHSEETAEMAVGLALASLRGIGASAVHTATDHVWAPRLRPSLYGRTALVVGFGSIGREVATRFRAFGVSVTGVARHARMEDGVDVRPLTELPELVADADIIVLILPHDESTHHLVDARLLARMHDGALLVNVARGGIVDTDALTAELNSGRISAALDVTDPEPLPPEHPLWNCPNLIITPHEGGDTTATFGKTVGLMRRQLARIGAGESLENVVAR